MGILQLVNIFLFWVFFGCLAAHFAKKRGRRPGIWFAIGLCFQLIGFLTLFLLPKVRPQSPKSAPAPLKPPEKKIDNELAAKYWYYLDEEKGQQGPYTFSEFLENKKQGHFSETSYIWGEGMAEWKKLAEVTDLKNSLKA